MSLLTDSDLTSMRAVAASALPNSGTIQTSAYASDGGGGGSITWHASGTVDCRYAPIPGIGAGEDEMGGEIQARANFIFTLPHDAAIGTDDRILVGGDSYRVEAIRSRSWNLTTRVETVKE